MTTVAPYRSRYQSPGVPGQDGFAQALRAEWTKFRTVRGWVIGAFVGVLVMAGIGLLASGGGQSACRAVGTQGQGSSGSCQSGITFTLGPNGEPVSDSFYFVGQPLAGDGTITVRVTSLTGLLPPAPSRRGNGSDTVPGVEAWAKAGLIIKENLNQGSAYAAIMVAADHGVRLQWNYTGDTAGLPGTVGPANPRWLRLTRSGDVITGYDSADGTHWSPVGTVTLAGLPVTAQVGLFAASPDYMHTAEGFGGTTTSGGGPTQATAAFDHLATSGGWTARPWAGQSIGQPETPGVVGYRQSGDQFTLTGQGDIAPIPAGHGGPADPAVTVPDLRGGRGQGDRRHGDPDRRLRGAGPGHRGDRARGRGHGRDRRRRDRAPVFPGRVRGRAAERGQLAAARHAGGRLRAAAAVPGIPPGHRVLRALLRIFPAGPVGGPAGARGLDGRRPGPGRLPAAPEGRVTSALHAEWTKFRTLAGPWWLLLAAAALTIAVSAAAAAAFTCPQGACNPFQTVADPARLSLTGVYLGQVIIALLAVGAIGGEYGSGMIRLTLTATPRRLTAFTAKALVTSALALTASVLTASVLTASVLAVGGSALAGWLVLPARGLSAAHGYVPFSLGNAADLRAACGTAVYLTLIALLAFGVTTAVRDSAVGIGTVLGLLFLLPIVSVIIPDQVLARHLKQIAPMTAGLYIQSTIGVSLLPLTPWQGLGVSAAWAAGALTLGAAVFRLRDA
jgi:ABC-type transport system involved in multi-copper enzyme maturation permease subunit